MDKRLPKKPTLHDVALRSAVSAATVSRVLSGKSDFVVRPDTRARILEAAKQLDFRPNVLARNLRTNRSSTIALIIPDMDNPVYTQITRGVEEAARDFGYFILIGLLEERSMQQQAYISWIREQRVDGLIMGTGQLDEPAITELLETGSPFVLFFGRSSQTNNHVTLDDSAGAKLAVNHLLDLGHQRIGCLSGPLIYDTSVRRLQGYRQSFHENGVPFDPSLVEEGNWVSWEDGRDSFERLLSRCPDVTGVFAATLTIATGALRATKELGLRVPEDMSIIGLHDAPFAQITSPPLTVVKTPLSEMGYRAMSALIEILTGQPTSLPNILSGTELIIRESTGSPR